MGGLWDNMGPGALAMGFGSASGLWFGSSGPFEEAKIILEWGEEIQQREAGTSAPPV